MRLRWQRDCSGHRELRLQVAGGVVVYYVLAYITGNAQALAAGEQIPLQRFSDMGTGVIENKKC